MSEQPYTNLALDFGVEEISNVGHMQGLAALNRVVFNSNYGFLWPGPNLDFIVRCAIVERSQDQRFMNRAEVVFWHPLPPVLPMLIGYVVGGGQQPGGPGGIPMGADGIPSMPQPEEQQQVRRGLKQIGKDLFMGLTQRRSLVFGSDMSLIKEIESSVDLFDNSNVLPDWRNTLHQTGVQLAFRKVLYREATLFAGPNQEKSTEEPVEISSVPAHLQNAPEQQSFYQLQLNFTFAHKQLEKAKSIWGNPGAAPTPASGKGRAKLVGLDSEDGGLVDGDGEDEAEGENEQQDDPETALYSSLKRDRPSVAFSFTNSAVTHMCQLNFLSEIEIAKDIDILSKLRMQSETVFQPNERTRIETSFQLELVKALSKGANVPPVQDPATGQDLQEYLSTGKNLFSETVRISRQFTDSSVTTLFTQVFSQTAEINTLVSDCKYMIGLEHQHFTPIGESKTSFFFPFFDPQNSFSFQIELRIGSYLPSQEEIEAFLKAEQEARFPTEVVPSEPEDPEKPVVEESPTAAAGTKKKWSLFGKKETSESTVTSLSFISSSSSSSSGVTTTTTTATTTTNMSKGQKKTKIGQITEETMSRVLGDNYNYKPTTQTMTSGTSTDVTNATIIREKFQQVSGTFGQVRRTAASVFNAWSQRRFVGWSSFLNWRRAFSFSTTNFVRALPSPQHLNSFNHQ
eukprot:TRINITY_DN1682_c0_g1_i2.p1 TRINITY_DN1682_c0_g1~~TRINITY_DN1682_c0_g1_i2.p1  ORF type:complete len:683 (+),score=181.12 TRINITY_DN1682_c0_g1_i2:66-2114(+)